MCFIDSGDYCTIWDESDVKARKRQRCDCCGATIEPGTKYLTHFHVFHGEASRQRMCLQCRDDRQAFADEHDGYLSAPDDFPHDLSECIAEHDPESQRWVPMLERMRPEPKPAESIHYGEPN